MTVKSRYLGPRNRFTTWRGSLVNILDIQKKFLIAFETVVEVVSTIYTNCRIILVRTKHFTQINISVRNSVFAYLFIKKLLNAAPAGLKYVTHIFYVQKSYFNGNVFTNIWIVSFPSC
jgi:hypothetical protein